MQEITSVIFSQDSKLLAAQGGDPDWNLVLWQWEKSKLLASIRTSNPAGAPMTQVYLLPMSFMYHPRRSDNAIYSRNKSALHW